jgi:hypothetical protein
LIYVLVVKFMQAAKIPCSDETIAEMIGLMDYNGVGKCRRPPAFSLLTILNHHNDECCVPQACDHCVFRVVLLHASIGWCDRARGILIIHVR